MRLILYKYIYIYIVRTGFGNLSPLRVVVPCTSTQAQTIELFCVEVRRQLWYSWKLSLRPMKWFSDIGEQIE